MEGYRKLAWWIIGVSGLLISVIHYLFYAIHLCTMLASRDTQAVEYLCGTDIRTGVEGLLIALMIAVFPVLFSSRRVFVAWLWFAVIALPIVFSIIFYVLGPGRIQGSFINYTWSEVILLLILFVIVSYGVMIGAWLWGRKYP
jgi:hypothetical protein